MFYVFLMVLTLLLSITVEGSDLVHCQLKDLPKGVLATLNNPVPNLETGTSDNM